MIPRTLFLGTPAFAVASLDALHGLNRAGVIELVGVITQPDRAGNRGKIQQSAVKSRALELGLPVFQPASLRNAAPTQLLSLRPQLLVWAAYGNLIPGAMLEAVVGRAINVHASLLPRHRGAAPIAHAILAGDLETGVTLMEGTVALDAGPIVALRRVSIAEGETTGQLTLRLAEAGAELLRSELPSYIARKSQPTPQDENLVTWAPKLSTSDSQLDFGLFAEDLARRVRAFNPDPGAWTTFRGQRLGILRASDAGSATIEPGTFAVRGGVPHVGTGAGWLRLDEVQSAGKRAMSGSGWARGLRDLHGTERMPS